MGSHAILPHLCRIDPQSLQAVDITRTDLMQSSLVRKDLLLRTVSTSQILCNDLRTTWGMAALERVILGETLTLVAFDKPTGVPFSTPEVLIAP